MTTETESPKIDLEGFTLKYVTTDPGGYKRESKHVVTVTGPNGRSYSTDYTMGPLRFWKRTPLPTLYDDIFQAADGKALKGKEAHVLNGMMNNRAVEQYNKLTTHRPIELADVMYCLVLDANCVRHGQSFDDYCDELGYDNDSIKVRKCFDNCRDIWSGLISIGADLDKLSAMFQDY